MLALRLAHRAPLRNFVQRAPATRAQLLRTIILDFAQPHTGAADCRLGLFHCAIWVRALNHSAFLRQHFAREREAQHFVHPYIDQLPDQARMANKVDDAIALGAAHELWQIAV